MLKVLARLLPLDRVLPRFQHTFLRLYTPTKVISKCICGKLLLVLNPRHRSSNQHTNIWFQCISHLIFHSSKKCDGLYIFVFWPEILNACVLVTTSTFSSLRFQVHCVLHHDVVKSKYQQHSSISIIRHSSGNKICIYLYRLMCDLLSFS